jgi:NTP pyrophosphatase (non-canonical NTP hydrolase)
MKGESGTEFANPTYWAFIKSYEAIAKEVHGTAVRKGWWASNRNDGEMIALMHSELSEALEALRASNPPSDKVPGFSSVEEELADVLIRIMDYGTARGFRLAEAVLAKANMNETRSYKHGGKLF